jgi:Family of unknown function (DUF6502)
MVYDSPMAYTPNQSAVLQTLQTLLQPVARLAVAHGLPYNDLDEALRQAMVDAAQAQHTDTQAHGMVSRISASTGLARREVTRLLQTSHSAPSTARWPAGEVFTRWLSDPAYGGRWQTQLPRQGQAPSFESLAQTVTRDMHPRSLLEELIRLGMVDLDEKNDTVSLQTGAMVPKQDFARMLAFMADNVGDHFQAAIDNVLGNGKEQFEQAIFADELSEPSVQAIRTLVSKLWAEMFARLVPELEQLIEQDKTTGNNANQRTRIGFYAYTAPMTPPTE